MHSDSSTPSDFQKLARLTLPLMFTLLTTTLMSFFDRLFLANHSMTALEIYVSGSVLVTLFQAPLMRMTTLGQAFVSSYNNPQERHRIGESVWQLIWLSLLSIVVVLPIGYAIMPFALKGSPVEGPAIEYFSYTLWGVFLFPLQAALTSFFIGRKETKVVLITTIAAQCLHVLLDYLLIFGVVGYIPSLGTLGPCIALIVSQALICSTLFCLFLKKSYRAQYGTGCYRFNWQVFYKQLHTGVFAALAPFISLSSWTATAHIMSTNGPEYLTVFSIGSTLTLSFFFVSDAFFQSVMIFTSSLLKEGNFAAIKRLVVHAIYLLGCSLTLLAIPFFIYTEELLSFFFPSLEIAGSGNVFFMACYASWLFVLCKGMTYIGMGLLAATQQTSFFIFTGSVQWVTVYTSVFVAISAWHWGAATFWFIISANAMTICSLYFLKARQLINIRQQELAV